MTVKTAEMAPSLPCQITTTKRELKSFEKYKKARYLPVTEEDGCHLTLGDNPDRFLLVGKVVVEKRGVDLPLKKNLANHLDDNGHFDVLLFFDDHRRVICHVLELGASDSSRDAQQAGQSQIIC